MIKNISIGEHSVEVEILPSPNGAIAFKATVGDGPKPIIRKGMLNPTQVSHDHTEEQFRKDVDDFASRLAQEAAGAAQAALLSARIFSDETNSVPASDPVSPGEPY